MYNGGHAIDVYDIEYTLNVETTSGKPVWLVRSLHIRTLLGEQNYALSTGIYNYIHTLQTLQDYVLVVPEDLYTEEVINILPIDSSGAFINECGDDNFHVE